MKFLIIILLAIYSFLFCYGALASNFMAHSKILDESIEAHQLKSTCEHITGEKCYDVGIYPSSVYSEKILKESVELCLDPEDCQKKLELKQCPEYPPVKNLDNYEVYCIRKVIQLNAIKVTAYEESLLDIEIKKQKEEAIAKALASMECGKRVIAQISVANDLRELTIEQIIQQSSIYNPIATLLERGALKSAKASISQINADGIIIREQDKSLAIDAINECDPVKEGV